MVDRPFPRIRIVAVPQHAFGIPLLDISCRHGSQFVEDLRFNDRRGGRPSRGMLFLDVVASVLCDRGCRLVLGRSIRYDLRGMCLEKPEP